MRWSEFGVSFNEFETDAQLIGDGPQQGRLAHARRTFKQQVSARVQRSQRDLHLTTTAHNLTTEPSHEVGVNEHQKIITPRMFSPSRMARYPSLISSNE